MKVKTGSLQQRSLKAIFPPLIALLCAGCVSVVVRENIVCESGFRTAAAAAAAFATDIQSQRRGNAAAPNGILSSTWAAASGISSFLTLLAARKERTVLSHQPSNCSQLSFSWDAEKACYSERITEGKFIFLCSVIPSIKLVVIFVIVYHQPLVDIMGWVSSLHANHGCHRSIVNRWKSSDIISKGAVHHQVRLDRSVQDTKILSTLYEIQIFTCSFFKSLDRRT